MTSPDLGAALRIPSNTEIHIPPELNIYVQHKQDLFRITIILSTQTISGFTAYSNDIVDPAEAMAIRFELASGVCTFCSWVETEPPNKKGADRSGAWVNIPDFTSGEASRGGPCELTGEQEVSPSDCQHSGANTS